ncbi:MULTISPECIES: DUF2381 family protein [unclassified Myxococcus]|uniref:DUF2381 family protein n=1 Tax=Myxococcus TaxID=32 RepID=UPI0011427A52|nr:MULTISPECIES: DUF2381 family protein [unclassified Myxococcus]NOK05860.1 DUF2381 family protein [Myxococcus xanthus]
MFPPGSLVMTAVVLLLGTAALAQTPDTKRWRRIERAVVLSAGAGEPVQRLRLAPGVVTTVLLDSDAVMESDLPDALRGLFTRLDVTETHLLLQPAVAMPARGVPPLVLRFTDAAAPQRLVLELTTEGSVVDSVVDVRRHPAAVAQLEAELVALRERNALLEARLATARRPLPQPGLANAVLSGAIGPTGVLVKWMGDRPSETGLKVQQLGSYRSGSWLTLAVKLENPLGEAPWQPGIARLTHLDSDGRSTGETMELPLLLQEPRLLPGQSAVAVVQWPAPTRPPPAYALEIWDTGRRRGARWARLKP